MDRMVLMPLTMDGDPGKVTKLQYPIGKGTLIIRSKTEKMTING